MISTFPSLKIDINHYPAVKTFLEGFKPKIKQTGETLTPEEISSVITHGKKFGIEIDASTLKRSRKKTNNKWFETQDSIDYWEDFNRQKVIYPNMTKYLPFVYDNSQFLTNQKCFIITGENIAYLTAFLNSSLFKFCFRDNFPELQGGTRELSKIFFEKLPVLQVSKNVNLEFDKLILDLKGNFGSADLRRKLIEIDGLIFDLYNLTKKDIETIGFIEFQ